MIMDYEITLRIKWKDFLKEFFHNNIFIEVQNEEKMFFNYSVKDVFGLNISITGRYGFFNIEFQDGILKEKFKQIAEIEYNIQNVIEGDKKLTINHTNYSIEKFPCRVFPQSGVNFISFYDLENIDNFNKKIENRVITFEAVMFALLRLRILDII